MNTLDAFNHSLYLMINGADGSPDWQVNLALLLGEYLVYLVPVALIALWHWGSGAHRALAVQSFSVAMLGVGLNQLIALFWEYPRPFVIGLGHTWIAHVPDSSFPSDHMTVVAGFALSLLWGGAVRLGLLLSLVAVCIAWGRIFLGVHYPLDMLGAVLVAALTWRALQPVWRRFGADFTALIQSGYRTLLAWPIAAGWLRA